MSWRPDTYCFKELDNARHMLVEDCNSGPLRRLSNIFHKQLGREGRGARNLWEGDQGLMEHVVRGFPMPLAAPSPDVKDIAHFSSTEKDAADSDVASWDNLGLGATNKDYDCSGSIGWNSEDSGFMERKSSYLGTSRRNSTYPVFSKTNSPNSDAAERNHSLLPGRTSPDSNAMGRCKDGPMLAKIDNSDPLVPKSMISVKSPMFEKTTTSENFKLKYSSSENTESNSNNSNISNLANSASSKHKHVNEAFFASFPLPAILSSGKNEEILSSLSVAESDLISAFASTECTQQSPASQTVSQLSSSFPQAGKRRRKKKIESPDVSKKQKLQCVAGGDLAAALSGTEMVRQTHSSASGSNDNTTVGSLPRGQNLLQPTYLNSAQGSAAQPSVAKMVGQSYTSAPESSVTATSGSGKKLLQPDLNFTSVQDSTAQPSSKLKRKRKHKSLTNSEKRKRSCPAVDDLAAAFSGTEIVWQPPDSAAEFIDTVLPGKNFSQPDLNLTSAQGSTALSSPSLQSSKVVGISVNPGKMKPTSSTSDIGAAFQLIEQSSKLEKNQSNESHDVKKQSANIRSLYEQSEDVRPEGWFWIRLTGIQVDLILILRRIAKMKGSLKYDNNDTICWGRVLKGLSAVGKQIEHVESLFQAMKEEHTINNYSGKFLYSSDEKNLVRRNFSKLKKLKPANNLSCILNMLKCARKRFRILLEKKASILNVHLKPCGTKFPFLRQELRKCNEQKTLSKKKVKEDGGVYGKQLEGDEPAKAVYGAVGKLQEGLLPTDEQSQRHYKAGEIGMHIDRTYPHLKGERLFWTRLQNVRTDIMRVIHTMYEINKLCKTGRRKKRVDNKFDKGIEQLKHAYVETKALEKCLNELKMEMETNRYADNKPYGLSELKRLQIRDFKESFSSIEAAEAMLTHLKMLFASVRNTNASVLITCEVLTTAEQLLLGAEFLKLKAVRKCKHTTGSNRSGDDGQAAEGVENSAQPSDLFGAHCDVVQTASSNLVSESGNNSLQNVLPSGNMEAAVNSGQQADSRHHTSSFGSDLGFSSANIALRSHTTNEQNLAGENLSSLDNTVVPHVEDDHLSSLSNIPADFVQNEGMHWDKLQEIYIEYQNIYRKIQRIRNQLRKTMKQRAAWVTDGKLPVMLKKHYAKLAELWRQYHVEEEKSLAKGYCTKVYYENLEVQSKFKAKQLVRSLDQVKSGLHNLEWELRDTAKKFHLQDLF